MKMKKTTDYNFEKLPNELKAVRIVLKLYTILSIASFLFFFLFLKKFELIIGINYLFVFFFLSFIWFKLPMTTYDKVGETILITIFGVFALWMWIPDQESLQKMIEEYKIKENNE